MAGKEESESYPSFWQRIRVFRLDSSSFHGTSWEVQTVLLNDHFPCLDSAIYRDTKLVDLHPRDHGVG
jgi:hypothetical protein